jgi:integrase
MMIWKKSEFPGVRFYEHDVRKHGIKKDRNYYIRYKHQGRTYEEAVGWASQGNTARSAYDLLSELKRNQKAGTPPFTLKEKCELAEHKQAKEEAARMEAAEVEEALNVTWSEVWPRYLEHAEANKKPNTARTEKLFEAHWVRPVITANTPLRSVSPFHLEKIKAGMLKAGKSPRSIEYTLALIRQVFNFCSINGLFHGDNPVTKSRVKAPKFDNRRLRYLSKEEAARLLDRLTEKSLDVHDICLLSLHSGARAGEIFALTWGDVDMDRNILTLRDTKNGETRKAFVTAQAVAMLRNRRPAIVAPSDLVFPGQGGKQIKAISKTFERTVDELGLNDDLYDARDHVVFHSLRHTYASMLVESGVALFTVKEMLGHKDIRMTARYAHLGESTMLEAAKRLEGVLGGQAGANEIIQLRHAANS